ncbi:hypothetical protein AURDEDRAFT_161526 [Auricularia subglabra TFB-10046 SS5]|nr:hypothetical protein AURDEDRAFT_161526 [Auricularia subglabra TFB-10046 SS5]
MDPYDNTALVPTEILLAMISSLRLDDLARLAQVSKRWRDLVKAHPAYWAAPGLNSAASSSVAFFLARIAASEGKPLRLHVTLPEPTPLLETTLLPSIARHLDYIDALIFHVHVSHSNAVFDLLRAPASSLRALQLFFECDGTESTSVVLLPEDILSQTCHPQGLSVLCLQNVDLPRNTGYTRSLVELKTNWITPLDPPHGLLGDAAVSERVVTIAISLELCAATLRDLLASEQGGVLVCQQLRSLKLLGHNSLPAVTADDLSQFVLERLQSPSPISVALFGVPVDGTLGDLMPTIDVIYEYTEWRGKM